MAKETRRQGDLLSAAPSAQARAGGRADRVRIAGCAVAAAALALVLAACGSGPRVETSTPVSATAETQPVKLSANQLLVVEASVKKMIASPESAKFSRATGLSVAGQPGVHVCGHVTYKGEDGKVGPARPYYLELRDSGGEPVAERGQVGSDPSTLSKVNFMCRRHNNG